MVLDADDEPDRRRLEGIVWALAEMGATTYLEHSRRGAHLWFFLAKSLPGRDIRRFGLGLFSHFHVQEIELFPKQDQLRSGPGSMIRLPFGVHRKSGRRYGFWTFAGEPLAPTLREQIRLLANPVLISQALFDKFVALAPKQKELSVVKRLPGPGNPAALPAEGSLSERIKAAVGVREFVEKYVELSRYGKGICPFHDDHIPSFYVNEARNFWFCFACDEGGSIIDFWMKRQGLEFGEALKELADRYLL
jgi:hypothetical protein